MKIKGARRKICKWIYGHKQSGSNITTRGDYIITQYEPNICYLLLGLIECGDKNSSYWEQGTSSTNPSKNWTWFNNGLDGAHAYANSNHYYTIDYKGYPDPIIKQSGSTYYIDYGAVDMNGQSSSTTGIHLQVNPNCTELPCPAGTTNQGTFYNHTAATAGAGLGVAEYTIIVDSICPSGWMLPAFDATENKSLYSLFISAYGGRIVSSGGTNADVVALYPPISFLRGGSYDYNSTNIYNPGIYGTYWQNKTKKTSVYSGYFATAVFMVDFGNSRGRGSSLRCVSRD